MPGGEVMPITGYESLLKRIKRLEERVAFQETNNEKADAFTIGADDVDFDALTSEAQVYVATLWQDSTAWILANNNNWQQDTQSTTITVRRKSDVIIISDVAWSNATASRINGQAFRWTLGGAAVTGVSSGTGNIGNVFLGVEHHYVGEQFQDVAAGVHTLQLESQKTQVAWSGDTVTVYIRTAIVLIIPKD